MFNIIGHRLGGFAGVRVLDGFAGTGALGLEALSRGTASATFIDRDRDALALCRRNAQALGLDGQSRFQLGDLTRPPREANAFDLVFLDPPYGEGLASMAMMALVEAGWLAEDCLLVVESEAARPEAPPAAFRLLDTRCYGRTRIDILDLDD